LTAFARLEAAPVGALRQSLADRCIDRKISRP
jgi:hypothetical protein